MLPDVLLGWETHVCHVSSLLRSILFIYLFDCAKSWLWHLGSSIFTVACGIFSCSLWALTCSIWDLVPWLGINPGPTALGVQSLSHWTIREIPAVSSFEWQCPWWPPVYSQPGCHTWHLSTPPNIPSSASVRLLASYSVAKSCLTLCNPMDYSMIGFCVLHHLPEFAQTHVHWVGDTI